MAETLKASELIAALQDEIAQHGDLFVYAKYDSVVYAPLSRSDVRTEDKSPIDMYDLLKGRLIVVDAGG
jgi:hypothetical protein